ncbi:hypothetical protein BU26DRAFT_93130 [Trematosphaeria pertusa]|uniref:Uncharacterized protein n=1 Tax=Trematosphaeria pertusa TaxID=390896 RepID=A0A6A6I287_9PLEO|nr:uncharacterized protein BU26DRAFT_93130 [Trematosphaeria pertusa]KAF2244082.1 hypothetical protein BU26DRAFT_93130 [Trematosphaeria pertusa]
MVVLPPLSKDPYVLAYRYREYMAQKPRRPRESNNAYHETLLANQPDPARDATDARSRAIRYAKEHHECYYEIKHINMIVQMLDDREAQ